MSETDQLKGIDIAQLLSSKGPTVKCVFLKAKGSSEGAEKIPASVPSENGRVVLTDMIDEIEVDTTPQKSMVSKILGGPFTFLGQYEEEGTMLMVRKTEGIDLLDLPPFNPHLLQPPFQETEVRGDILIMKVAQTNEVLDNENEDEAEPVEVLSNEEFFLDYTKAEYVAFASRTDVVPPTPEIPKDDDDEGGFSEDEEEDDENDQDFELGEDDECEAEQVAVMNLVMREVIRKFNEDNGRGPSTQELLEFRSGVAAKMGVPVPKITAEEADWTKKQPKKKRKTIIDPKDSQGPLQSIMLNKRTFSSEGSDVEPVSKKVKFGSPSATEAEVNG